MCAVWWQEVWSEQGLGSRQGCHLPHHSPCPPVGLSHPPPRQDLGFLPELASAPPQAGLCTWHRWQESHSLVNMAEPTPHIKSCPVLSGLGQALLVSIRLTEPQNAPLGWAVLLPRVPQTALASQPPFRKET